MKRFLNLLNEPKGCLKIGFLVLAICAFTGVNAQNNGSVTGKLRDDKSMQIVPYGYIKLTAISDSTLLFQTFADENGIFKISRVPSGKYSLVASSIGYSPVKRNIDILNIGNMDAGTLSLQEEIISLNEAVVVGEHLKARSERDKTTYFITKKIVDATSTGSDVLKLIPGIQIDLMQNIAVEGSQKIQIFVDGKERDKSYISQLNPKQIEKVEVITAPPSNYDSTITGVINIILKKELDSGFSGHIYSEIPTSGSEIFMFPACSLNYGFKKWNLFASYSGEMTYLNIHEKSDRRVVNNDGNNRINSDQDLRQKDWSHKFHYGFDYFLSPSDQFNFYAFCNPYSRELDGNTNFQTSGSINSRWQAKKEDQDINSATSFSLYYKHNFVKQGEEITLDISNYNLRAENSTEYSSEGSENKTVKRINSIKPVQHVRGIRLDYTTSVSKKLNFSTGIKGRFQTLQERNMNDYSYTEKILAIYGTANLKYKNFDLSLGVRTEKSLSDLKNRFSKSVLSVLPYATFRYKITAGQNLNLSFNRTLSRPNLYQLIPSITIDDPKSILTGNPNLNPELRSTIFIEHSVQFKSNYFASRLFYSTITDAISNLMSVNDTGAFETRIQNLGAIHKSGIQFSGSFKAGIATLNPYLQIYALKTFGNVLANQYGVPNKNGIGFDSGLSAILSFKHDFAFSLTFQYATPKNNIQDNSFCDALYFLSLEKSVRQKIKIGIVSGIPFTKSFVYRGSEINGVNFTSRSRGIVTMSTIPVWFKISYQINSGRKRANINRTAEETEYLPKKGF